MQTQKIENTINAKTIELISRLIEKIENVNFPEDRFYSGNYTWIKFDGEIATVGLNALIVLLYTPLIEVIFLCSFSNVEKNEPCAWVKHRDGILTIRSPIQGELFDVNKTLSESPDIINRDPYSSGWLFKIKTKPSTVKLNLLTHNEFLKLHHEKVQNFKKEVISSLNQMSISSIETLPDGGQMVETLKDLLGVKRYFAIVDKIFIKTSQKYV